MNVRFESDQEEQQQNAELREEMQHRAVRIDQVKAGDTDDDAAHHFAQHGWLSDSLSELAEDFCGREDREQRDEQFGNFHVRLRRNRSSTRAQSDRSDSARRNEVLRSVF